MAATEAAASNEWTKTTLQLELVSTMVCPSDDNYSMAVIRDMSTKEKDPEMYRRGSTIGASAASVYRVLARRVYILNGRKPEYLELDGVPRRHAVAHAARRAAAGAQSPVR